MSEIFNSIKVSSETSDQVEVNFEKIDKLYSSEIPIVILEIKGGVLQRVESTVPIHYFLIDRDNIDAGEEFPTVLDYMESDLIVNSQEFSIYLKNKMK